MSICKKNKTLINDQICINIFVMLLVLLATSCKCHYVTLPNRIMPSDIEKIVIERPYSKIGKQVIIKDKEDIYSLYDFFYKHEMKVNGFCKFTLPFKITFFSNIKTNIFWFNDSFGIGYHDLNNNRFYYLNTQKGKIIIDKFLLGSTSM